MKLSHPLHLGRGVKTQSLEEVCGPFQNGGCSVYLRPGWEMGELGVRGDAGADGSLRAI